MNAVLIGATRGIGRSVARELARRGDRLFLLGRSETSLRASAADLELLGAQGSVGHAPLDLCDAATFEPALTAARRTLGFIDAVIVTAGVFASQDTLETEPERFAELAATNFTGTIQLCEAVRVDHLRSGAEMTTLGVLGSVAGDRARKPVALYGATKAGLAHYLEGLDLRYRTRGLRVVTVKPGFIRTSMTAGAPEPPFAADPADIAPNIVRAIDRGTSVTYVPGVWRWIMTVIRALPRFVLRRTEF